MSTASIRPHHCHSGKHALGDRARKLDKGILIVRFELPFNIWWYGRMTLPIHVAEMFDS